MKFFKNVGKKIKNALTVKVDIVGDAIEYAMCLVDKEVGNGDGKLESQEIISYVVRKVLTVYLVRTGSSMPTHFRDQLVSEVTRAILKSLQRKK